MLTSPHSGGSWSKGLRVHRSSVRLRTGEDLRQWGHASAVLSPGHRARERAQIPDHCALLEPRLSTDWSVGAAMIRRRAAQLRLPGVPSAHKARGTREWRRDTRRRRGHQPGVGSVFSVAEQNAAAGSAAPGRADVGPAREPPSDMEWRYDGSWLARCVHQPRQFGGWRRVATGSARFVLLRRTPRAHAGPRGCNTISQVRVPATVGCSTR